MFFGDTPCYDEEDFRKIHRIPRDLYMDIYTALYEDLTNRTDATGVESMSAHIKLMGTLRWLGDAGSSTLAQTEQGFAPSTICAARLEVCRLIVEKFGSEYLRRPNDDELKKIESEYAERGFPGCIGAIDCMHVYWRKCPTALKGAYQGRYILYILII